MKHLEIGKKYLTRDGREVTIESINAEGIATTHWGSKVWANCGAVMLGKKSDGDIVSEINEGPVRTVTRREIVPGKYGRVTVFEGVNGVAVEFNGNYFLNAEELREAAHTLNQIAEALEDV